MFQKFQCKIAREVSSYFLLKNNKAFVQINIYVDNNGGKTIFGSTIEMRLKSDFHTLWSVLLKCPIEWHQICNRSQCMKITFNSHFHCWTKNSFSSIAINVNIHLYKNLNILLTKNRNLLRLQCSMGNFKGWQRPNVLWKLKRNLNVDRTKTAEFWKSI